MTSELISKLKAGKGTHGYLLLGSPQAACELFERICRELEVHPADKMVLSSETISIAEVRQLIGRLIVRPFGRSAKAAYLEGKLTFDAVGALLKIVEEPPGNTLICFHANHPDELPATLVSRLETVRLKPEQMQAGDFPSYAALARMNLRERFALAAKMAKQGRVGELIDSLLVDLREQIVYDVATQTKIESCLQAKRQLAYNVNQRLLLETLLIKLSHGI